MVRVSTLLDHGGRPNGGWSLEAHPRYEKRIQKLLLLQRCVLPSKICRENGNNFNKNFLKARMERPMINARGHATTVYDADGDHPQSAVYVDKASRPVPTGNLKHTVGDIHNILKAYNE